MWVHKLLSLRSHQRKAPWDQQWPGRSMPGWCPAPEILACSKGVTLFWVFLSKCGSVASKQDIHTINNHSLKVIYLQVAHVILTLNAGSLSVCPASSQCQHQGEHNAGVTWKQTTLFHRLKLLGLTWIKTFNRRTQCFHSAVRRMHMAAFFISKESHHFQMDVQDYAQKLWKAAPGSSTWV